MWVQPERMAGVVTPFRLDRPSVRRPAKLGMPGAIAQAGLCHAVLPLPRLAPKLLEAGVDVMLPETHPEAAVATLVRLQRQSRVLDRDVISLDLRLQGRMFARLTEDAAAARVAVHPKKGGPT